MPTNKPNDDYEFLEDTEAYVERPLARRMMQAEKHNAWDPDQWKEDLAKDRARQGRDVGPGGEGRDLLATLAGLSIIEWVFWLLGVSVLGYWAWSELWPGW